MHCLYELCLSNMMKLLASSGPWLNRFCEWKCANNDSRWVSTSMISHCNKCVLHLQEESQDRLYLVLISTKQGFCSKNLCTCSHNKSSDLPMLEIFCLFKCIQVSARNSLIFATNSFLRQHEQWTSAKSKKKAELGYIRKICSYKFFFLNWQSWSISYTAPGGGGGTSMDKLTSILQPYHACEEQKKSRLVFMHGKWKCASVAVGYVCYIQKIRVWET